MRRVVDESKPSRSFKYSKMFKYLQEYYRVPFPCGSACHCVTQGVTAHRATVPMTTYKYDETGIMAACRNFVENFKDGYKKLSNQDKKERGFTIVPKFSTK